MRQLRTALFVMGIATLWPNVSGAEVVADWNVCAQPIIAAGRASIQFGPGPSTLIDLAVMHLAMHDAIQAYDHRFEPYAGAIAGASGSPIAAAGKAAHDVLASRLPSQKTAIDACYAATLSGLNLSPADLSASEAVGMVAANNVLLSRDGDSAFPTGPITPFAGFGMGPGQWSPNTGTTSMVAPWLGAVRPLALDSVQRCQPDDPPALTSADYAEAYNEVKAVGAVNSTERTADQGHMARTYSGNFQGQFNRLMRDLAEALLAGTDLEKLGDRARLFALANTSAADAVICAWSTKKKFGFWRPSQAIRRGDTDGNILTVADPTWSPYLANPNYPDYTSGANNVSGSMTRALELFFGTDRPLRVVPRHGQKDNDPTFRVYALTPGVPLLPNDPPYREYTRFSDIAKEVVDARVYLGIHFRFADTEARSQGRRAAGYAYRNILQPIKE